MSNDYQPEWVKFIQESLEGDEEAKKEYKPFWDKVWKLRKEGIKCSCGNDECEGYGHCAKCFLRIENPKWTWMWAERQGRWLCVEGLLYDKMIKYKTDDESGALIMATNQGKIWVLLKWYFWNKQGLKCAKCRKEKLIGDMELHHIIPKCKGGRESEDNLQMLCKLCHRTKMMEIYD